MSEKESENSFGPDELRDNLYAAIDLGSNACRLLVVGKTGSQLKTIEAFSRFTRLAQDVSRSNVLSEEAIERTTQALKQCAAKIRSHAPLAMRAVATEAVRRAWNRDYFLSHIKEKTGISLEVITQDEEAKLILKGCASLLDPSCSYGLVFDIGGGSTEIIWARLNAGQAPQIADWISLPFGVVTLSENYKTDQAADFRLIQQQAYNFLENFTERNNIRDHILARQVEILGTSGTATVAFAIHQGLKQYDRLKINGAVMQYSDIRATVKIVQMMSAEERNYNRCMGVGRSDLVLGGFAILESMCDIWPVGKMKVTDRGVREGIVTELAFGEDPCFVYKSCEKLETAA